MACFPSTAPCTAGSGDTKDFHYFYQAATAFWHGTDIYAATRGRYSYPPLLAFLFQPLFFAPSGRSNWLGQGARLYRRCLQWAGQDDRVTTAGHIARIWDVTWSRSVSVTSAAVRFTRARELDDVIAYLAVALIFALLLAAIFALCWRHGIVLFTSRRGEASPESKAHGHLEWAVLIVLALTFSPQSPVRHLTGIVLVIPAAIALLLPPATKRRGLLLGGLILAVAGLSFRFRLLGLHSADRAWTNFGAPSWCALALLLALVAVGARTLEEWRMRGAGTARAEHDPA